MVYSICNPNIDRKFSICHEFYFHFSFPEMNIFPFRIYESHMLYVMAHVISECSVWFIWKTFKAMDHERNVLLVVFCESKYKNNNRPLCDIEVLSTQCLLLFFFFFFWIMNKFIFNERLFFEMRCLKFSSDTFDCDCLLDIHSFSSQYSTKHIIIMIFKTTWTATEEAFL